MKTIPTVRQVAGPIVAAVPAVFLAVAIAASVKTAASTAQQPGQRGGADASAQVGEQSVPQADAKAEPQMSEEARTVLTRVRDAYARLNSLQLAGKIVADFDVGGEQQKVEQQFTASFQAPNKFRHQVEDNLIVGSTGSKVFAHSAAGNSYLLADAPDPKAPAQDLPRAISGLLTSQNPSLLLAIEKDPLKNVAGGATHVEKSKDVRIGDKSYAALHLRAKPDQPRITLLIDPDTHLIRRLSTDLGPVYDGRGAQAVNRAFFVVDYTTAKPDVTFGDDHFAWSPPEGATEVASARPATERSATSTLVGKPAPDFRLESLKGKTVALSDLKGKVVLLDFWASWCPPCRESLPHLGRMYGQKEEGVEVLAVNLMEDTEQVRAFVKQQGIEILVLLDKQGQVAAKYGVSSIPQSVLIGKDGEVKRVFVGMGPDTFSEIRQEIQSLKRNDAGALTASEKTPAQPAEVGQEQLDSGAAVAGRGEQQQDHARTSGAKKN